MKNLKFILFCSSFCWFSCTKCMECTYQLSNTAPVEKIKKCARKEELEILELAIKQEYPIKSCKYVSK